MWKEPPTPSLSKGVGVCGLMVAGCVRIGNQDRRAAEGSKFGHSRGSGATNHQMCPTQPHRYILEEAVEFCGHPALLINRSHGGAIFRAHLLADPNPSSQLGRQGGHSRRHNLTENMRSLAAAQD